MFSIPPKQALRQAPDAHTNTPSSPTLKLSFCPRLCVCVVGVVLGGPYPNPPPQPCPRPSPARVPSAARQRASQQSQQSSLCATPVLPCSRSPSCSPRHVLRARSHPGSPPKPAPNPLRGPGASLPRSRVPRLPPPPSASAPEPDRARCAEPRRVWALAQSADDSGRPEPRLVVLARSRRGFLASPSCRAGRGAADAAGRVERGRGSGRSGGGGGEVGGCLGGGWAVLGRALGRAGRAGRPSPSSPSPST